MSQPRPERPDVSKLSAADAEKTIAAFEQRWADWAFSAKSEQLNAEDQKHLAQSALNGLRDAGFHV